MPLRHPNAEVARRLWSAVAEGDVEALEEVLAPGLLWRSIGNGPLSGDYLGRRAVRQYMAEIGERADDFVSNLEDLYVNADGAVIVHKMQASRGERSIEMEFIILLRIVDGLVVRAISIPVDQTTNDSFWS